MLPNLHARKRVKFFVNARSGGVPSFFDMSKLWNCLCYREDAVDKMISVVQYVY